MKKALIVTYYWPPCGGSGVQRWMYFARYLEDFGIKPIVLTVSPQKASYKDLDYSLLQKVNTIETYTTNTLEPLKLYSFLVSGSSTKEIPQGHVGSGKHGLFGKLSSFIRGNFFIPDARVGWNRFAIKQARKIIKAQKIDFIITTGPPHSSHLIGMKMKEEVGIFWMADFRDPWSELFYNHELIRMEWAKKKDEKLELEVLSKADRILTVGPSMRKLLAEKISDQQEKFHFILNGYDDDALHESSPIQDHFFRITYIGFLGLHQPYQPILKAMKHFCENRGEDVKSIKLIFAGAIEPSILNEFKSLKNIQFEFAGRVEHRKALQLMISAQLLLNCLAESEYSSVLISGKLMEYIATRNPVLCIGDVKGDAAALLHDIPNAKMFAKDDSEAVYDFIVSNFEKWKSKKSLTNDSLNVEKYSRYNTAKELAEILNKIS